MTPPNFGKYHIRRELGRGAMGLVYEAEDVVTGREVALKVMALSPTAPPEAVRRQQERFDREAMALSQLNHPRVVRLLDQGQVNGRHFFAMELVRGTTLRDRIQLQGPLSVPELTRLAIEMAHALDHIHLRGVVHRDVKPENLMLLPDGGSMLMDFGVARLVLEQETAASSGFQGSPAYMSPEQVAGYRVDGRSDLYSLAVTLYEAATGRRAVEGDSIPAILHRVAQEYPTPPAGLPPSLQAVLMRAMAKDPTHRYARGSDMAEDIREGRIPQVTFSPIPAPPPAAQPAGSVYLGTDPAAAAASAWMAAPDSRTVLDAWTPVLTGQASPAGPPASACALHPHARVAGSCAACGQAVCYTCLLEIPGRGILCRVCAFLGSP